MGVVVWVWWYHHTIAGLHLQSGEVELAKTDGRLKAIRTGVSFDEKVANHTILLFERPFCFHCSGTTTTIALSNLMTIAEELRQPDFVANKDEKADGESDDSSDEALCEMLGLSSLSSVAMHEEEASDDGPHTLEYLLGLPESELRRMIVEKEAIEKYRHESVASIPASLCLDPSLLRRITDELLWGQHPSDKSYETIKVLSQGEILERRKVTRFENFVPMHQEWSQLCEYIGRLATIVCGETMTLFKEKLNLKPPGGSGFAPHLDTPSLRVALGKDGPQDFVTVMVAIDSMTEENGCLQFVEGNWSEENAVETILPDTNGNPDGNGRAGAIPTSVAEELEFQPVRCPAGSIYLFNGFTPHRSSANQSPFPRRAVFLTYNGGGTSYRSNYYEHMERLRSEFRIKNGLQRERDAQAEMEALATVPT